MDEGSTSSRRIEVWVNEVEDAWSRLGVPGRERRRLASDLERDLEESVQAGADLDDLLVEDSHTFARELALAGDVELSSRPGSPPETTRTLITTMVGGGIAGAIVTWYVIFPIGLTALARASDLSAILVLYPAAAACVVGGAVAAARWRFRDHAGSKSRRIVAASIGFVVGGLLGIGPTTALSAATGYTDQVTVVLLLTLVAASFCASGSWFALRLADRPGRSADAELAH